MSRLADRLFIAVLFGALAIAQPGGVVGLVTSTDGTPIANAKLTFSRMPVYAEYAKARGKFASGEGPFFAAAASDARGNHATRGLPDGSYLTCVSIPGRPFLDPCKWSAGPVVHVQNGATAKLNIPVKLGVFLEVRVNDPHHPLPAAEQHPLDFPTLIVGVVFGTGAFLAAQRTSVDSGGQDYVIAIPSGVPLNLWFHSRRVLLADAKGQALANGGAKIPFQAVQGADQSFAVTVTGAAPQQE